MSTQLHPHGLKFFSRPGFISDFNRKKQHLHHVPRAMIKDRSAPNLLQIRPKTAQAFEKPQGTGKFFSRPDFMSEFNRKKLHLRHVPHNMIKDRSAPDLRQFKQRKAAKPSYPQGYKLFSKPEFMSDFNKRKSHLRRVPQNMIKDRSAPDLRQFKQRRGAKRPHFETAKLFSKPEFMSDFNKRKSHLRHLPRSAIKDRSAPNLLQFKQRKSTKQAHPQSYKLFSKPEFMSDFNKKKMRLRHLPQNMIRDRSSPNLLLLKQEKWQSKWMPKSQKASTVAPYTRQNFKYFSRPDFMSEFNRKKVHLRHIPYSMMRDRSAPDLLLLKQEKWQNQWSRGAQKGFVAPPAGRTGMVQELRESVQRPAVLREKIIPIEEEDVQPIVHRQIERREIHEVVQPIHERQVLPATVEERQLPAENRQFGNIQKRVPIVQPNTTETAPATRSKIVNPPIIQETVRKTVIEEIQPVVHRDTITTRIIRETLPIYEKVIEPEVVIKEVRPALEHALDAPSTTGLRSSGTFGEKYAFDIEQKTTLQPGAASRFGRPLHK